MTIRKYFAPICKEIVIVARKQLQVSATFDLLRWDVPAKTKASIFQRQKCQYLPSKPGTNVPRTACPPDGKNFYDNEKKIAEHFI